MVDGVASFHAADGGGDISACGGATAAVMRGITGRGVALGRSMVVLCWLGGLGDSRGGGRCGSDRPWLLLFLGGVGGWGFVLFLREKGDEQFNRSAIFGCCGT